MAFVDTATRGRQRLAKMSATEKAAMAQQGAAARERQLAANRGKYVSRADMDAQYERMQESIRDRPHFGMKPFEEAPDRKFFRKVVNGLVKVGDVVPTLFDAAQMAGVPVDPVTRALMETYKAAAPPGSKYYQQGTLGEKLQRAGQNIVKKEATRAVVKAVTGAAPSVKKTQYLDVGKNDRVPPGAAPGSWLSGAKPAPASGPQFNTASAWPAQPSSSYTFGASPPNPFEQTPASIPQPDWSQVGPDAAAWTGGGGGASWLPVRKSAYKLRGYSKRRATPRSLTRDSLRLAAALGVSRAEALKMLRSQ